MIVHFNSIYPFFILTQTLKIIILELCVHIKKGEIESKVRGTQFWMSYIVNRRVLKLISRSSELAIRNWLEMNYRYYQYTLNLSATHWITWLMANYNMYWQYYLLILIIISLINILICKLIQEIHIKMS